MREFVAAGGSPVAVAMVHILALTGMRLGEVQNLRRNEIDRRAHALRLADTKSGASVRPLSHSALDVLDEVNKNPDCPCAFRLLVGTAPIEVSAMRSVGSYRGGRSCVGLRPIRSGIHSPVWRLS